jgi:hypothetical protein
MSLGLKPVLFYVAYAALKRRSSTIALSQSLLHNLGSNHLGSNHVGRTIQLKYPADGEIYPAGAGRADAAR